jgi:fatty-acyl-CoA synthase
MMPFVEQGRINKWGIPRQIALVAEVPKTSVGKLDKKVMRQQISQWLAEGNSSISSL